MELRANFDRKAQLEAGFTVQESNYANKVQYIDGLEGIREFIRTPNDYGYAILKITPNKNLNTSLNYVYTGKMLVPHFAGSPGQDFDEMVTSKPFHELSTKLGYTLKLKKANSNIEFYSGVKNIFNAYQNQFDTGKNRDSNFVYGPAQPRTFFIGLKIKS
jgi:outer membrane receptor for ferrienterochelin and colicins